MLLPFDTLKCEIGTHIPASTYPKLGIARQNLNDIHLDRFATIAPDDCSRPDHPRSP